MDEWVRCAAVVLKWSQRKNNTVFHIRLLPWAKMQSVLPVTATEVTWRRMILNVIGWHATGSGGVGLGIHVQVAELKHLANQVELVWCCLFRRSWCIKQAARLGYCLIGESMVLDYEFSVSRSSTSCGRRFLTPDTNGKYTNSPNSMCIMFVYWFKINQNITIYGSKLAAFNGKLSSAGHRTPIPLAMNISCSVQ